MIGQEVSSTRLAFVLMPERALFPAFDRDQLLTLDVWCRVDDIDLIGGVDWREPVFGNGVSPRVKNPISAFEQPSADF